MHLQSGVGLATGPDGAPALDAGHVLLVTTCWWPSLAYFGLALLRAGCRVSALCPRGHPLQVVPGVRLYRNRAEAAVRRLSRVIGDCRPALVVPGDDRAVAHLHALHACGTADERALIERSLGRPDGYAVATSRMRVATLARELGIAVPVSAAVRRPAELATALPGSPGPWVIKTDGAWSGQGVRIATTRGQAVAAGRALRRRQAMVPALGRMVVHRDGFWLSDAVSRPRPELTVQGFVHGYPATLAMFCAAGEVLAATGADVVASVDQTGPSVVVRIVDRPDAMAAARQLARALGLTGFYGLDFMIEAATGRALLIELNPRFTPLVNVRMGRAADLVGACVQWMSGRPQAPGSDEPGPDGMLVAHFPLPRDVAPNDPRLIGAVANVPRDCPGLVSEMLRRPWPDRHLLARAVAAIRRGRG